MVSNIGALPERVKGIPNAFIFPYHLSGLELVKYLLSLKIKSNDPVKTTEEYVDHA